MGIGALARGAAVFLDRDGVINCNVINRATGEWESPLTADALSLVPGAISALRMLQGVGYQLIVVSNQPNYAKGKASLEALDGIHERLLQLLSANGVRLTASYYCLHHPNGIVHGYARSCPCRKPSPYFLFKARDEYSIDLQRSWMIGDRASDIECGQAAGTATIRVWNRREDVARKNEVKADYDTDSLHKATEIILGLWESRTADQPVRPSK